MREIKKLIDIGGECDNIYILIHSREMKEEMMKISLYYAVYYYSVDNRKTSTLAKTRKSYK